MVCKHVVDQKIYRHFWVDQCLHLMCHMVGIELIEHILINKKYIKYENFIYEISLEFEFIT